MACPGQFYAQCRPGERFHLILFQRAEGIPDRLDQCTFGPSEFYKEASEQGRKARE
jgi:hypothetical protein